MLTVSDAFVAGVVEDEGAKPPKPPKPPNMGFEVVCAVLDQVNSSLRSELTQRTSPVFSVAGGGASPRRLGKPFILHNTVSDVWSSQLEGANARSPGKYGGISGYETCRRRGGRVRWVKQFPVQRASLTESSSTSSAL